MPHQVFLSYSTKDTAATEAVCRFLEARGVRCWMAPRDIPVGHDWAEAIIGALNRCPVMVLIYSSNANASTQVTREVQRAFEKGLAVFPFRIEAVQPNPGLEYYLGSVHWLDALTPPLEAHMGKLATAVEKALKRHADGDRAEDGFAAPPPRPRQASAPAPGSRKSVVIATALAGSLALGGAVWWVTRHDQNLLPSPLQEPAPALTQAEPVAATTPLPTAIPEGPEELSPAVDEPPPTTVAVEPTPVPDLESSIPSPAEPLPPPSAATPAEATRELPWRDSFTTAYHPVPGTEVLFALWPTRVRDYETFAQATQTEWPKASFEQEPDHPAVNITWNDAQAYCEWLTQHEREADRLPPGYHYRLPTEAEWDRAVGLDDTSQAGDSKKAYPWGEQWPPPQGVGNYAASLDVDSFSHTSPVTSFAANQFGLYDMGGNVWQWCAEEPGPENRTARGGSWMSSTARELSLSTSRSDVAPVYRNPGYGFRCVLAPMH